jgi:hypothetical protein
MTSAESASPIDAAPPTRIHSVDNEGERKRILDATFPKYLNGDCPRVQGEKEAVTWTKLDELKATTYRQGLFVPRVLQRIEGSFSRAGATETLYRVAVGQCVSNGFEDFVDVIFDSGTSTPRFRVETSVEGGGDVAFAEIARKGDGRDALRMVSKGQPARWVRLDTSEMPARWQPQ